MLIPPKYNLTNEVVELLNSIDASRGVIDSITIPPQIEQNIRRQSTLRSSLFSARIEGNDLTLDELTSTSNRQKKAEVFNTLNALNWIEKRGVRDITEGDLIEMHKRILAKLSTEAGEWRHEMSATFNKAGVAIYMHPPPLQIRPNIKKLIKFINSERERFVPIRAMLAHYTFEKIHPFLDGNGRTGRLLIQKVLMQGGYGMRGLLGFEEYIDQNRSEYYRALEEPEKDVTDYLLYMLKALAETALQAKELVLQKQKAEAVDFMLPRRAEIYSIISDQKMVNFDQIKRRFGKVSARTLRYDLKKLQDGGFIVKLGNTKGVYYRLVKN